jgi:hypothetical protein
MLPRLPSSGRPASHEPRWGTATLSRSCECADLVTPAIIATVQSAPMNIVLVIISALVRGFSVSQIAGIIR